MSLRPIIASCVAAGLVIACGGGAPSPARSPGPPTAIAIVDYDYEPDNARVPVGSTVTFTNAGKVVHNVHWGDGTGASPDLPTGATYSRTFTAPGRHTYICGLHPLMTGEVNVTE
jgi:plastocyanin